MPVKIPPQRGPTTTWPVRQRPEARQTHQNARRDPDKHLGVFLTPRTCRSSSRTKAKSSSSSTIGGQAWTVRPWRIFEDIGIDPEGQRQRLERPPWVTTCVTQVVATDGVLR